jgi:hypothetical protein
LHSPVTVREQRKVIRVNHAKSFPSTNYRTIDVNRDIGKMINQPTNEKDEECRRETGTFMHTTLNMKNSVTGGAI